MMLMIFEYCFQLRRGVRKLLSTPLLMFENVINVAVNLGIFVIEAVTNIGVVIKAVVDVRTS
jgi:hypothetical protein